MADDHLSWRTNRSTGRGFAVVPGTVLANRYEILEYVGKGGMGVVYKALDRTLDETVAIKILRQQFLDDPAMTQRLLAEIKLARRVTHKNVCRIHDYGAAESVGFISMQFIDGIELREMVRIAGGLNVGEGYDIALQLVDGLEAIHDQGIVHRDFKTANVMIDRHGTALLMDFGIAKFWQGEAGMTLTAPGQIVGSPQYMSPEQAQGEPLDPRSDIYALGVVLFELFTGTLPFTADNFAAMLYKKVYGPLELDSPAAARLPAALAPVIRKALAPVAVDRYPSTRELRAALLEARAQTGVEQPDASTTIATKVQNLQDAALAAANPASPDVITSSSARRRWLMTGVTVAAVVLISIIVRTALPFFQPTSDPIRASTVSTSTPPTVSGRSNDSSQAASSAAVPSSETDRSKAGQTVPSTVVSANSSDRETNLCDDGDAAACMALAQAAEATKDFARAADLYLKACNGRAAAGCTAFGVLYNRGLGVTRDAVQAAMYYERGCALGDMAGCNNLGTVYQFGSIGFRDPAKAAGLYERACSTGHVDGCANLGLLFLDSPGLAPEEQQRARQLLQKACAAGIARACDKIR